MTTAQINQTEKLGKMIMNNEGRTAGPKYGQVFTAPAGEHGFIAGYRRTDNEGLGLIGREWFAKKRDAENYATKHTS
jgi:hypothetical protein